MSSVAKKTIDCVCMCVCGGIISLSNNHLKLNISRTKELVEYSVLTMLFGCCQKQTWDLKM